MSKILHEIRDPVHAFIQYDGQERALIDSLPFQRLRHIHQLAMTSYVYPGASHKRFEHSLGVMELATQIFDAITSDESLRQLERGVGDVLKEPFNERDKTYWKQVLRAAALCHDIGHLPFSHAAEKELLPEGSTHETITRDLILDHHMRPIWEPLHLESKDVAKIAVGPKDSSDHFTPWEALVSEIITGDVFGADRMDYLLRDSHHLGVAYGKFDHHRLIQTLRILPHPRSGNESEHSVEPVIGIERGGMQAAESLLWARYLMFSQVYFHPVRRAYDRHLQMFMQTKFGDHGFPTEWGEFLSITDNEICTAIRLAATKPEIPGSKHAHIISSRAHFKKIYQRTEQDISINPRAVKSIFEALRDKFGVENFLKDDYLKGAVPDDFPVLTDDKQINSAMLESHVLRTIPPTVSGFVFVDPAIRDEAKRWLKDSKEKILLEEGTQ